MKRRFTFVLVGCAVLAGWVWFLESSKQPPVRINAFAGRTNGLVGAIAPTFGKMTTNHAAVIRRWLDAGTNGALFTVKNDQPYAVDVFPIGRMYTKETPPMRDETPLLNAPNWSGIRLPPGQATTIQVAVLPHGGPWKMELYYYRDPSSSSWLGALVNSLTRRTRRTQAMQSDWIEN